MKANEALNEIFKKIELTLDYNPEWANGTGYMDYAVSGEHAPVLQPGHLARFIDDKNRKAIVLATVFGNIVAFERYKDGDGGIVVANSPDAIKRAKLVSHRDWSVDQVYEVFNDSGRTLHDRIMELAKAVATIQAWSTV